MVTKGMFPRPIRNADLLVGFGHKEADEDVGKGQKD